MATINTSRAKEVTVNISDYDNLPLSLTMYDISVSPKVVIDLSAYKISFDLKEDVNLKANYTINASELSTAFLSKLGSSHEVLNMQLMWENIRTKCLTGIVFRLIMSVTRPDGTTYVYTVYKINASNY